MAIDIRNINEITFTQSFRGYNTDEVDEFLDSIYEEAVENNKGIEELKKQIEALGSGAAPVAPAPVVPIHQTPAVNQEEAYAIIANAQQEADRIIEAARQKAHAMIENAEGQVAAIKSAALSTSGVSAASATVVNKIDSDTIAMLKKALNDMYAKQMKILEDVETAPAAASVSAPAAPSIEAKREETDIPSISFAGITRRMPKIPAERDILGEINSINLGEYNRSHESLFDTKPVPAAAEPKAVEPVYEAPVYETPAKDESVYEIKEEPSGGGLAFSFAHDDEEGEPEEPAFSFEMPAASPASSNSYSESQAEDPDDIIAQILRDNNRN